MNSNTDNNDNTIKLFKGVSFLEGVSYILLMFVGMPMKYMAGNDVVVKSVGMPHGILFLAYIIMALIVIYKLKFNGKTSFAILIASLIPFGTFYINKKYFS